MWQRRFLRIGNVLQQRASRRNATREIVTAKSSQVFRSELCAKKPLRTVQLEMPWRAPGNARAFKQVLELRCVFINDDLGWLQALEFAKNGFYIGRLA